MPTIDEFELLYQQGGYTAAEYFWFALPMFNGGNADDLLWKRLPEEVHQHFHSAWRREGEALKGSEATAQILAKLAFARSASGETSQ